MRPHAEPGAWPNTGPGDAGYCSDFQDPGNWYCQDTEPCVSGSKTQVPCAYGEYGPAADYWGAPHEADSSVGPNCIHCGNKPDPEEWCLHGDGGVYAMCGHRPYTAAELTPTHLRRGDQMGTPPTHDPIHAHYCDGVFEAKTMENTDQQEEPATLSPDHGFYNFDRVIVWSLRRCGTVVSISDTHIAVALDAPKKSKASPALSALDVLEVGDITDLEHLAGKVIESDELSQLRVEIDRTRTTAGNLGSALRQSNCAKDRLRRVGIFFEDPAKLDPPPRQNEPFLIAQRETQGQDLIEVESVSIRTADEYNGHLARRHSNGSEDSNMPFVNGCRILLGWYGNSESDDPCWETADDYHGPYYAVKAVAVARIPLYLTADQLAFASLPADSFDNAGE